ncbi:hypothetical protein ABID82_007292 [Methylobacterium sp. PvP062]|uniref:Uncharacterized protein n=1 Tax=Methylobacterium radiotolerans TaxID=31998 RepID=A0ABV2NQ15_9HYPH|nr:MULTISPECIES: hypothetical protein [unclassified Methylobacterium]MBP2494665.1 hypothetical protein [Methylobacterium sp. PvP105]MBP2494984.1 hypothetical protein [Methylobacterium sp. PvP105]MBP2505145.1 hypothetical protein [Methylobacterium sp. PvP109]MBP2505464.1 hypothetical protein [Methylobacterium sp. PvP109]
MRSRPIRTLADRVAALEDQIDGLASSTEDRSDGSDCRDEDIPERDPADQSAKISARPVRGMGVSVRSDLTSFVGLEIIDYAGKPHRFLVEPGDLALLLPPRTQALAPSAPTVPAVDPDEELTRARARLTNAEAELKERELQARALVPPREGYLRADKLTVGFDEKRGVTTLAVTALGFHSELAIGIDPSRVPWLIEKLAWAMGQAKSDEG